MKNIENTPSQLTPRENFLMTLLHKITKEYKILLEMAKRTKPFKIVEILYLSTIPGETKFAIQITNKNCVLQLTAAEIINHQYDLNDFNEFHAEMIRQAAQGKLIDFLKLSDKEPIYKIISKKYDRELKQYIFTIEDEQRLRFTRTAEEITNNKNLLSNLNIIDIYDIAYTQGSESVLKEKAAILLARTQKMHPTPPG